LSYICFHCDTEISPEEYFYEYLIKTNRICTDGWIDANIEIETKFLCSECNKSFQVVFRGKKIYGKRKPETKISRFEIMDI